MACSLGGRSFSVCVLSAWSVVASPWSSCLGGDYDALCVFGRPQREKKGTVKRRKGRMELEGFTCGSALQIYLAVVDLALIVVCVNEFAILNVFVGLQPYWYRVSFPYFIHPLKERNQTQRERS